VDPAASGLTRALTPWQCALPVLDGLLPTPHNTAVLDLVFVMGCWHAYAKLRLHTEQTLASFEGLTADLGTLLRHFSTVTCAAFKTTELPRERAARIRRAANGSGPMASGGGSKPKGFNLSTYKLHALGDYPQTIRERGTTDNYTTQRVGEHGNHLVHSSAANPSPIPIGGT
jgi:phage tail protein X